MARLMETTFDAIWERDQYTRSACPSCYHCKRDGSRLSCFNKERSGEPSWNSHVNLGRGCWSDRVEETLVNKAW